MGQSTDAYLSWGFQIEEDSDEQEKLHRMKYSDISKVEKETGGKLVTHCCPEEPMYIVSLQSLDHSAYRGSPKALESLEVPEQAQRALDRFADALEVKRQPGRWILSSYWG